MGLMALVCLSLVISACGSSSSSSSSSPSESESETTSEPTEETETEEGEEGESEASGGTEEIAGVTVELNKEYAPGVPTLEELYKGEETPAPTKGPKVKPGVSVVMVSCGQENPGCAGTPNAMVEATKKMGWNYRIVNGRLNEDNGYDNGMREAIALKPDAIVAFGISCSEVKQPLEEAKAAGIPVMALQAIDCSEEGGPKLFEIPMWYSEKVKSGGAFFHNWGYYQGAYVIDSSAGEGQIIRTAWHYGFGPYQTEGQDEELEKCSGCEIVEEIQFTPEEQAPQGPVYQKFNTALLKHPEANVALMNWDTQPVNVGTSKAIVDAGRASTINAVACEGFAPANQMIREEKGNTAEACATSGPRMAWAALDEINRFLQGQPPAPEGFGVAVLTKTHGLPPEGQDYETKEPYKEEYEKLWGVN
jgi:ribose transport system substrate-binding protein